MDEELMAIIASLTNEGNTEIIEQLITRVSTISADEVIPEEPCQECIAHEAKYSALQNKYVERFMSGGEPEPEPETETEPEENDDIQIEDIFKKEGE